MEFPYIFGKHAPDQKKKITEIVPVAVTEGNDTKHFGFRGTKHSG